MPPIEEFGDNMTPLAISDTLRERLQLLRETQLRGPSLDEVFLREQVVILTQGFGPAIYLALDGRVIIWHYIWDEPPRETTVTRDIATGIVIGAKDNKMPELLDLLPARPDTHVACTMCSGERWLRLSDAKGKAMEFVCPEVPGWGGPYARTEGEHESHLARRMTRDCTGDI